MTNSKRLAGFIGPTMVAISLPEAINAHIWATQSAPSIYLNGALLFIAGFSIVRSHNVWARDWTVVVTVVGWAAMLTGLFRMFFPERVLQGAQNTRAIVASALVASAIGLFLTFKAYWARLK